MQQLIIVIVTKTICILSISSNLYYFSDGVVGCFSIMRKSPNMHELYGLIRGIAHKWRVIANEIKVDGSYCETLTKSVQFVDQDGLKLEEVLNKWESSQCSPVTWERIIEVLYAIDEKSTADIVSKHVRKQEVIAQYREKDDFEEFHLP